jgi:CubicO group peptidase (beta-lactamase class C family)
VAKNRTQIFLGLIVLAVGGLFAAILGLFAYMGVTATPLHPDLQSVRSVTQSDPARKWVDAVERGRQVMRAGLTDQNLPGLSVAVGIDGEIVWAEGFGWADLENKVAVAPDMRFRTGTASTVLTSAAVGLLLEKGQLKLDEKIQTYVPEFPQKEWPVTLHQLMANVSGVTNDGGDEGPLFGVHCERPVEALPHVGQPLLFEPGSHFHYSSYGWILMSAAVETAADEPFLTFMRKQVFEPLGMTATRADSTTEPIPDLATFYFPRFAANPRYGHHLMREIDLSCYAGASVFLSTPSDLVRFGMAIDGGKLLQPATVQLLQTPQRLTTGKEVGKETGYGLGWDLETVTLAGRQTRVAGHDGNVLGGRAASLLTFPEHHIVVSVMSNTSYADTFALGTSIAQAFVESRK